MPFILTSTLIITALAGYSLIKKEMESKYHDYFSAILLTIVVLFLSLIASGLVVSTAANETSLHTSEQVTSRNIIAMKSTDTLQGNIGGSFLFTSGSISTGNYMFVFYEKLEDGSIVLSKIPAENTKIIQGGDVQPAVESHYYVTTCRVDESSLLLKFFATCALQQDSIILDHYVIRIPDGVIIPDIDMSLP